MAVSPVGAAGVVLVRNAEDPEVFWVRRGARVSFMAGFHAFPGGRVDAQDAALDPGDGDTPAGFRAAAIRELFEETGVLLAGGDTTVAASERDRLRKSLLEGEVDFASVLAELGAHLDLAALQPAGHWVTPPFAPRRFDTRFFLAALPEGTEASVWPGELAEGEWIRPVDAVARWADARALLAPPVLYILSTLAETESHRWAEALIEPEQARGGRVERIEFRPGIVLVPLATMTIPPATHTNTYVIGGSELLVVDPGAHEASEQAVLMSFVDPLLRAGASVKAILITHHHIDHVAGVNVLRQAVDAPVWAHADTAKVLGEAVELDRVLTDDEDIELAGSPVPRLRALHTPGHASGHLCFLDEQSGSLLTGDLVVGAGTVVVDPPDGSMLDYMNSLRRVLGVEPDTIFPGHGPVLGNAPGVIEHYIAHRTAREDKVIAAIANGHETIDAIVPVAYADTPPAQHIFARRSLLAILEKLVAEGRVTASEAGWKLASTG